MKIVIDVDKLVAEGKLSAEEAQRLKTYAEADTSSAALNILIGFGVIATAAGALALLPYGATALALGLALSIEGGLLAMAGSQRWVMLSGMLLLVGALLAAGGLIYLTQGEANGFVMVSVLYLASAALARSGLLASLAALSLATSLGAMTGYQHASYMLCVAEPGLTVVVFTALSLAAYQVSKILPLGHQGVAVVFARTCLFVVNLGFWVGSLWGDYDYDSMQGWAVQTDGGIPARVFVVAWAAALVATGVWAANHNKRWVVNCLAVFAAIHFYTQYFEHLDASPGTLLLAGVLALGFALGLSAYNQAARLSGA